MRTLLLSLISIAVVVGSVSACGSTTRRSPQKAPEPDAGDDLSPFCAAYCARLADCGIGDRRTCHDDCAKATASAVEAGILRAEGCLNIECALVVSCVDGQLELGQGGSNGGGGATGNFDPACPAAPVACASKTSAQYCSGNQRFTAVCESALAEQGIVSAGCESNAAGDGCTIDSFVDPDCEAGTPAFALCHGLGAERLVDTYVTCYAGSHASTVIPCYADYVNQSDMTVDCAGAQFNCGE